MDSKRTTLTTQLRDGELEHVVIVRGEAVQAHTSRAAALCALMLALACAGCATVRDFSREHPYATTVIATSLLLSAGVAAERSAGGSEQRIETPGVDCSANPGSCK